jgi:hypothetical protein
MAGVKYAKGLQVSTWDYGDAYSMDWNLNGQYETLSAVIGLDDADNKNGADIVLSGDDQPLKQFTLKPGDLPQQLTLSVHGVLHLSATVNPHKAGNSPTVDFANAIVK